MSLYSNIKKLCANKGVKIGEVEKTLEIARGYISDWDEREPSYITVKKVADYFGVTIDQLINGGSDERDHSQNGTTA
jgi:transcriptional regulator with XRE-family HTH domain